MINKTKITNLSFFSTIKVICEHTTTILGKFISATSILLENGKEQHKLSPSVLNFLNKCFKPLMTAKTESLFYFTK